VWFSAGSMDRMARDFSRIDCHYCWSHWRRLRLAYVVCTKDETEAPLTSQVAPGVVKENFILRGGKKASTKTDFTLSRSCHIRLRCSRLPQVRVVLDDKSRIVRFGLGVDCGHFLTDLRNKTNCFHLTRR